MKYLVSELPQQSNWGVIIIGSQKFEDHLVAAKNGADIIRVGFEDSNISNGEIAESNAELVKTLRKTLEGNGFQIIQGDLAKRKLLGF